MYYVIDKLLFSLLIYEYMGIFEFKGIKCKIEDLVRMNKE